MKHASSRQRAGSSSRPLLSAFLIVKDEENDLPRCLASLRGKVDEIVVVDTGSTDHTAAIATENGAKLRHFAWVDDFSAARNYALSKTTGRWLLWVDADEVIVERVPGALRDLCSRAEAPWGYFLDVLCPSAESGPVEAVVKQWRLFPRSRGVRFVGRVHEHPAAPRLIQPEDVLSQDDVSIYHWGYIPTPDRLQRKHGRNRRLIERCISEEPEQPRHYFNLGLELVAEGDDGVALRTLMKGIERWFTAHGADTGYVPGMFSVAAAVANRLKQPSLALDIERQAPPEFVSSELLLEAGLACSELGRHDDALDRLERASRDAAAVANIFMDRSSPEKALAAAAALRATVAPKTPLVTACLIVKNEEANLPRCLDSIKPAVDEVIVVDTGSTDRTVEIAEAYGARTFSFAWCDDFSAARNESLRQARGDYIIWIDADDEFFEQRPGALRRLCQGLPAGYWGYWVKVHCPTDEWEEGEAILNQARVFRNHIGVQFHGRLHEQAAPPDLPPGALLAQHEVRIKHWGYIAGGEVSERRSDRNRRILEGMVADQPEENFHHYNLGLQFAGERDFESALPAFERAIELWSANPGPTDGYIPNLFSMAVMSAVELSNYARALELEALAPSGYVSADLLHHAGVAWWQVGHPLEALERFERALNDRSTINSNVHDRSTSTWRPLLMMACVYVDQGDFERAYEAGQKALALAPGKPHILFILAHTAKELGKHAEALRWARQLLAGERDEDYKPRTRRLLLNLANELDEPHLALEALSGEVETLSEAGALFLRARAHAMAGELQQQYDVLDAGCRRFPEDADIRLALAELLQAQGLPRDAIATLAAGMDYSPAPAALFQRLAALLAREGQLEDAANALTLAEQAASLERTSNLEGGAETRRRPMELVVN